MMCVIVRRGEEGHSSVHAEQEWSVLHTGENTNVLKDWRADCQILKEQNKIYDQ